MTKSFIAQQAGARIVKIFSAETGQLYRTIDVGGDITSPPICTQTEMYVGVKESPSKNVIKYYKTPTFALNRVVPI